MVGFFLDSSVVFSLCHSLTGGAYALFKLAEENKVALYISAYVLDEVDINVWEYMMPALLERFLLVKESPVWKLIDTTPDEDFAH